MQLIGSTKHLNALWCSQFVSINHFSFNDSIRFSFVYVQSTQNTNLIWDLSSCCYRGHLCSLETWLSRAVYSKLDIMKWWMWKRTESDRNISDKRLRSSPPLWTPLVYLVVGTLGWDHPAVHAELAQTNPTLTTLVRDSELFMERNRPQLMSLTGTKSTLMNLGDFW